MDNDMEMKKLRFSDQLSEQFEEVNKDESIIVNINKEGAGKKYFFGLVRMTQFKYLRFVTIMEIVSAVITILHMGVFYFAENEVIRNESFVMEFEGFYFLLCNVLPMFLMIWQFTISQSIEKFYPVTTFDGLAAQYRLKPK